MYLLIDSTKIKLFPNISNNCKKKFDNYENIGNPKLTANKNRASLRSGPGTSNHKTLNHYVICRKTSIQK